MKPEGELELRLAWDGRAVQGVEVVSTRPDAAAQLLPGRPAADAAALVARLYSICRESQGAAARLAIGAAAGAAPDAAALAELRAGVQVETIREYGFRALLDWPRVIGEAEDAGALRAMQAALPPGGTIVTADAAERIALQVLGQPAGAWLAEGSLETFDRWLAKGATTAARLLATLRFGDGGFGRSDTALLPRGDGPGVIPAIAAAMDRAEAFCRQPEWRGAPAETGALSRLAADPLVVDALVVDPLVVDPLPADPLLAEIVETFGRSVLARFTARLREFAGLLAGTARLRAGASALGGGRGIGWVENARGMLVHDVTVADARIVRYRILAPTEWNFHPRGALVRGLAGTRYAGESDLRHRAGLLVQSLDPCVACRIEVTRA